MGETLKLVSTVKILEGRAHELEVTDFATQRNLRAHGKGVASVKKGGLHPSEGVFFLTDRPTASIQTQSWMRSCCDTLGRCLASFCLDFLFNGVLAALTSQH